MLDYRVENATIFNGVDFAEYEELGIKDGVIAVTGNRVATARHVIDGTGKLLTPAFVDTHSHADFLVSHADNDGCSSVSQGIGTLIVGNCGMSSVPLTDTFPLLSPKINDKNLSCKDHLKYVENSLSLNIGELIGHNTLRLSVMGAAKEATVSEVAEMCALLDEFLSAGWLGMSVGLNYPEAAGYSRRELLELSKVLATHNRPLTCHIRDQADGILHAMDEVIGITAEAGCRVLLSHLRPLRTAANRGLCIVDEMERRFDENCHAHFDMYPYVGGCTTLNLFFEISLQIDPKESAPIPLDLVDKAVQRSNTHGYADIHVIRHSNQSYEKYTVEQISEQLRERPALTIQKIYFEDSDCVCIFNNNSRQEAVDRLIKHDRCLIGSDAWLYSTFANEPVHPRNYGAFTGFLTRYVRTGKIELAQGLRRITSGAADYFGIDAGRIGLGKRADLALFSLDSLRERADFKNPCLISDGMDAVWIGGRLVFDAKKINGSLRPGARLPFN